MLDTREPNSVVEAAEQAAAAGDYSSAERLLREAAVLLEARLGPLHPDLANILNNLGVACEMADKPAEAETCYRRAHAIATAVLAPDHPFVATSRKNLVDFCEARGIAAEPLTLVEPLARIDDPTPVEPLVRTDAPTPVEPLPPPPAPVERLARVEPPSPVAPSAPAPEAKSKPTARQPVPKPYSEQPIAVRPQPAPTRSPGRLALGAVIAVIVVLAVIMTMRGCSSTERAGASPEPSTPLPSNSPAPPPATAPAQPSPAPAEAATSGRTPVEPPVADGNEAKATSASAASVQVVEASLCRNSPIAGSRQIPGEWHCETPRLPVSQGSIVFYTRVKSPTDTTVEHRWFLGDRLQQKMELSIRANQDTGYRTFSRATVSKASSDGWRVELRTRDGTLLDEKRFSVQ
jgi:hypothetical protein